MKIVMVMNRITIIMMRMMIMMKIIKMKMLRQKTLTMPKVALVPGSERSKTGAHTAPKMLTLL